MEQQKITCPKCQSINIEPYKKVWLGIILVLIMCPIGLLYLLLVPKNRCRDCKQLFPKMFEGTTMGKVGTIFLILVILFLLFGFINFLIVTAGN